MELQQRLFLILSIRAKTLRIFYKQQISMVISGRNHFKSDEQRETEEIAAQYQRGKEASEKENRGEKLDHQEYRDQCHYLDPTYRHDKGRKRYR